jgi:hypothetical protein
MTLNNIPAPVRPTDQDSVIGVLAAQGKALERNVNDPNTWIYVNNEGPDADQPWAPGFQNGFFNVGSPRTLLRYRFLRPYDPGTTQNAVQLQGSVSGGGDGLVIFTLLVPRWKPEDAVGSPSGVTPFLLDGDIHLTCHDDSQALVGVTVQGSTGDVYQGFV